MLGVAYINPPIFTIMKKIFTLAAAASLAAASLTAQAQVTVDGVLNTNELTAGNYVLLGKFTNPHSFGDHGLLSMYAASTATKVYIFVAGNVETNLNGFQLFMSLPSGGGVPAGTALPSGSTGTYFAQMNVTMEMPTNLALALRASAKGATTFSIEGATYTSATSATSKQLITSAAPFAGDGSAVTIPADAAFPALLGARVAYKNTDASGNLTVTPPATTTTTPLNPGNINPNTAAGYGGAGSYGWEIELDRAALGALTPTNPKLDVFVLQNGDTGGYISGDFIPQSTTPIPSTPNYGSIGNSNVDFATIPGRQAATFTLSATGVALAARTGAAELAMGVYPNPVQGASTVTYQVADRATNVNIVLTDLLGRTVRTVENGLKPVGTQTASVDASALAAGTYLMRVQVGDNVSTSKVSVL
jgi:hypothetical protein